MAAAATPILASSRLDRGSSSPSPSTGGGAAGWDLSQDIHEGVEIGKGGVLGISGQKSTDDRNDGDAGELALHLITSTLLPPKKSPVAEGPAARAFIIHPVHLTTFSPENLVAALSKPTKAAAAASIGGGNNAEALLHSTLNNISILRIFDFQGLIEAVAEVSETLHLNLSPSPSPTLVLIEGIDQLAEQLIRRSDAIRVNSSLVPLMRNLTVLSRGEGDVRVVVVNGMLNGAAGMFGGSTNAAGRVATGRPRYNNSFQNRPRYQQQKQPPQSIFFQNNNSGGSQFYFSWKKPLDQGIDTHLLVSRIHGQRIVEVAKDRRRGGVGRWCVWE